MVYEVIMDDGCSVRVACTRVDVGMHRGQIISMRVWPPEEGEPYYMRIPEQGLIAFIRGEDVYEKIHGPVGL